jgi:hypothetical protein
LAALAKRGPLTTVNVAALVGAQRVDVLKRLHLLQSRGLVRRLPHGDKDALWGLEPDSTPRHRTGTMPGVKRLVLYADDELAGAVQARAGAARRSVSAELALLVEAALRASASTDGDSSPAGSVRPGNESQAKGEQ